MACRDPTDGKFLELSVNGRADLIVSGEAELLMLNPFREISFRLASRFVPTSKRRAERATRLGENVLQ